MINSIQSISALLDSPEEMQAVLGESLWDIDFRQLQACSSPVSLVAVATPASLFMKTQMDGRVHQIAGMDKDYITFGLPTGCSSPVRFQSDVNDCDTLTRFDPAAGLDVVSEPGFAAYTASFQRAGLENRADSLGLELSGLISGDGAYHIQLPGLHARRLRVAMDEILSIGPAGQGVHVHGAIAALEQELACSLLRAHSGGSEEVVTTWSGRARVLRRALAYIGDHSGKAISVEALCRESACSISTLERAFQQHFGVSPKRYLTAVRLSGVRKSLLSSPADQTVGDIAATWGFWHLSKLAADYKRMFGELPSQTVRAA